MGAGTTAAVCLLCSRIYWSIYLPAAVESIPLGFRALIGAVVQLVTFRRLNGALPRLITPHNLSFSAPLLAAPALTL